MLHADHTMNASTFAARVCAATLSDMHSAVVAAIGTLKGRCAAGPTSRSCGRWRPSTPAASPRPSAAKLADGEKIMGFGHRVYKTEDPRATHLRRMSEELGEASGDDTYYRMSKEMEEVVLAEKGLYPNVDFYAATVYHSSASRPTCSPRCSRSAGWRDGPPTSSSSTPTTG